MVEADRRSARRAPNRSADLVGRDLEVLATREALNLGRPACESRMGPHSPNQEHAT